MRLVDSLELARLRFDDVAAVRKPGFDGVFPRLERIGGNEKTDLERGIRRRNLNLLRLDWFCIARQIDDDLTVRNRVRPQKDGEELALAIIVPVGYSVREYLGAPQPVHCLVPGRRQEMRLADD